MVESDKSFLDRQESEGLKGIMILLILLGHNIPWVMQTDGVKAMVWLYCFHIKAFFLLPFLYPQKKITMKRLADYTVRFYVPFIFFLVPLSIITFWRHIDGVPWQKFPLVFCCGGAFFIRKFAGNQLLWFLPAIYAATVVREIYASLSTKIKKIMFIFSVGVTIGNLFIKDNNTGLFFYFYYWIQGLNYLVLGCILRDFIPFVENNKKFFYYIFLSFSLAFYLNYFICIKPFYSGYHRGEIDFFLTIGLSMSYISILFNLKSVLSKWCFVRYLGRHSFVIYLTHIYFGYVTYWGMKEINAPLAVSAIACMGVMLGGSIGCIYLLGKNPRIRHFIMPINWKEFMRSFSNVK